MINKIIRENYYDKTIATRNSYGKGDVLWIPSLLGLVAHLDTHKDFQEFLKYELNDQIKRSPVSLSVPSDCLLDRDNILTIHPEETLIEKWDSSI